MNNFTYFNPTRIHFGQGQIAKLAEEIPSDAKVLITYGGGACPRCVAAGKRVCGAERPVTAAPR